MVNCSTCFVVLLRSDLEERQNHLPFLISFVLDIREEVNSARGGLKFFSDLVEKAKRMASVSEFQFHLSQLVPDLAEFHELVSENIDVRCG